MMKYTPLQTVNKCHRELWWTIRLLGAAEVQLDEQSAERIDLGEIEKVLRHAVVELGRVIRQLEAKDTNRRIRRPGSDLALKAQLAKARQAVASALKEREDGPSHK
jgi:hypothetical protein